MPAAAAPPCRDRALAGLAAVGLGSVRNALPHELADGERRRLTLARALATRPRLLLADEPTAGLDPAQSASVVSLIRSVHARGVTCLVTTQSAAVAHALEGRVLQLAAGRLDGYWELVLGPWDVAAGLLLVEEAGGRVTDLRGGPLNLAAPRIVASNGRIHDAMLRTLASVRGH